MSSDTNVPSARAPRRRGQRGETLLESMLAIGILSVVVAATFGGLQVALGASAQQRESATASAMLRNAAEMLQDPDGEYIDLAGCGGRSTYSGLPEAEGFGAVTAQVAFLDPPKPGTPVKMTRSAARAECPAADPGLQRIELSVLTPSGRTETAQIVKRRQ